ncbi:hypothetical protein B9G55_08105 [Saccharibacillus sp. O16]|nr:hypothetical protein B9G55_08105 [Saccharibacillus sp. O16]
MNERNIEELLRSSDSNVVPEVVEERLDEVFREIRLEAAGQEVGTLTASAAGEQAGSRRVKRIWRFSTFSAAGLLLLSLTIAGLAVMSPAFAQTLQRFAALGTMYSDKGIEEAESKGLIQSYPSNLESENVPFGVNGIIYDGARVIFDFYSKKSESNSQVHTMEDIKNLSLLYKGKELSMSSSPTSEDSKVMWFDHIREIDSPDKFELTLKVETKTSEKPYEIKIPVEQNTTNTVIQNPEVPADLQKYGVSVEKIILTPITTQVVYRAPPFKASGSGVLLNSIIDEYGRRNFVVSGYGDFLPGNKEVRTADSFEPLKKGAREFKLRFVVTESQESTPTVDIIDTIDMTVPIPAAVSSSQSK